LTKRYEAKDQKCDELRSKFTATKAALSTRERELETAQRLLQKSTAEKSQLKVSTVQAHHPIATKQKHVLALWLLPATWAQQHQAAPSYSH